MLKHGKYVVPIWLLALMACTNESDVSVAQTDSQTAAPLREIPTQVDWPYHGNDLGELRFSTLDQIGADNVTDLGLAWYADVVAIDGFEATPIVKDGVIYLTTGFSNVFAIDAKTGKNIWSFYPGVKLDMSMFNSWAARINRGVALLGDSVFVGTGDCRLISIDAKTGSKRWEVTDCDATQEYGITSAPRVGNGKVFVGNAGADSGARGFVSAYDAKSGDLIWRFWLVPGDPANGFENEAMKMAAKTWTGDTPWKYGGGSVWDSMSFDPELNLLYLGTASASALPSIRSPDGGDNLFLSSIVAVDADTGEYRWHYQTTPGESWHYDAANHMILTDLDIDGETRKVLLQAPKNGFFYVLDRETGELISANNFVEVNWAEGIDMETGRPIENPEARFYQTEAQEFQLKPNGTFGGHNWQPMSFNPNTGLVYLPAHGTPGIYRMGDSILFEGATAQYYGVDPDDTDKLKQVGKLLAWDPVKQEARWQADHDLPMNSGTLSTAGGLVFQGTATGEFHAYDAESGAILWKHNSQTSIQASPVTYSVDGVQYILIPAGAGGTGRISLPRYGDGLHGPSRLLAYKLHGSVTLPDDSNWVPELPQPPEQTANVKTIARGKKLFDNAGCKVCHGVDAEVGYGNSPPDLRYMTREKHALWDDVVLGGSRKVLGMPAFDAWLEQSDSNALQAFVIDRAHAKWRKEQAASAD